MACFLSISFILTRVHEDCHSNLVVLAIAHENRAHRFRELSGFKNTRQMLVSYPHQNIKDLEQIIKGKQNVPETALQVSSTFVLLYIN